MWHSEPALHLLMSLLSQCLSGRPPPTLTVDVWCLVPCPRHVPCSALRVTTTWMGITITSTVLPPAKSVAVRVTLLSPRCAVYQLLASNTAALERWDRATGFLLGWAHFSMKLWAEETSFHESIQMLHKNNSNVIHTHILSPALCQSRHGEIPDSSLQSTGSSRSSHSRSPSLHHMYDEDKPIPRRSHSHGYPHGHGPRGRLRSVRLALTSTSHVTSTNYSALQVLLRAL